MPARNAQRETLDSIESTAVSVRQRREGVMLHGASLQNPTEWRRESPFFGRVLIDFLVPPSWITRLAGIIRAGGKNYGLVDFWWQRARERWAPRFVMSATSI